MIRSKVKPILLVMVFYISSQSTGLWAQEPHTPVPPKVSWSFNGPFGTFNRAELQRGFQVYTEVCSVCHALTYLRYEKLKALGFSEEEIKAIAAQHDVPGPLNDEGDPTMRKATPGDFFARPYPNDQAARAANNGSLPPDLSLITKARPHGSDYVYALLTGYSNTPKNFSLMTGMHYNQYFPGHQIAMPAPLSDRQVTYADNTPATIQQMSHDVTVFLSWAAEPEMERRKQLGVQVLIYLIAFSFLMYLLMRQTWKTITK
jgi:ubiquinol-cytochrome c reductase cytochrome c1 subunit